MQNHHAVIVQGFAPQVREHAEDGQNSVRSEEASVICVFNSPRVVYYTRRVIICNRT